MFPVEYVYADWIGWQACNRAKRANPDCPTNERIKDTGSQVEGFCIPDLVLRNHDILDSIIDHWKPDLDLMRVADPFFENDGKKQYKYSLPNMWK